MYTASLRVSFLRRFSQADDKERTELIGIQTGLGGKFLTSALGQRLGLLYHWVAEEEGAEDKDAQLQCRNGDDNNKPNEAWF